MKDKIKNIASGLMGQQPKKEDEKNVPKNEKSDKNGITIVKKKKKKKKTKRKKLKIDNKKLTKESQVNIYPSTKRILNNMDKIEKSEKTLNFIDEEINCFSYNLAIQYDKRTYCQYYASLLKTQHNLICALFNNTDYNSKIVKIDLFLVGFALEYTINALFYNDDTMHEIYEDKGLFDFETQIPIIVYSTIISYILNWPLNYFALTNDVIIGFKEDNTRSNILFKVKRLIKILTIKFILYFIISFLFLLFFWYYIAMFCVIYKNTQILLLKDIIIGLGFSLLFPFGIYLIPGIFRILALSNTKIRKEYLYNFSKFLQSL